MTYALRILSGASAELALRFTEARSSSGVCVPSRFSLMTGQHAFRRKGKGHPDPQFRNYGGNQSTVALVPAGEPPASVISFIENRCIDCHDGDTKKGNLDLTALKADFADADTFARWVKVHDRVRAGFVEEFQGFLDGQLASPDSLFHASRI